LRLRRELETFLTTRVYRHYRVQRMALKGARILRELFEEFCRVPQLLPPRYQRRTIQRGVFQTVCDYVAGMTDRYAQDEYLRLFQPYSPS
jgi:dGTPase